MTKKKKKEKKSKLKIIVIYFILIISLLFLYSYYVEPYKLTIKEYKIENKELPKSFDGLKIIHFSDIHYGRKVDSQYLKKIVNTINKQKPDIVFFTGDFLDDSIKLNDKEIENIKDILSNINSTLGNYAVNGNHDIKDINDFKTIMDNNFTILDNTEKIIYYKDSTPISIIGLTDSSKTETNYEIFEHENNYFRFVLTHEPDDFKKIKKYNFNIQLSGHSHNGQIRIPFIGALYTPIGAKTYYDEHYKIDNKEIFISNGIGTSKIDIRLNSTPSINLYRLYAY